MEDHPVRPPTHELVATMDTRTWLITVMREPREWVDMHGKKWVFDDNREFTSSDFRLVLEVLKLLDGDTHEHQRQRERDAAAFLSSDDAALSQTFRCMKDPSTLIRLLAHLHLHKPHRLIFFSDVILYDEDYCLTILDDKMVNMYDVTELYILMSLRRRYCNPNSIAGQAAAATIRGFNEAQETRLAAIYHGEPHGRPTHKGVSLPRCKS